MRWCTYISPGDGRDHVALLHDGLLHGLRDVSTLVELWGDDADRGMEQGARSALENPLEVLPESEAVFRAPVPRPPSVRDFMAFEEHVRTSSEALGQSVNPVWYEIPLFYFTNPAAARGPHEDVPVAPGSQRFDYELEVGAVVGCRGSDLDPATAERWIAGYTLLCDWSARDLQEHEMLGNLGPAKSKDTATSFSPYLVTKEELEPFRAARGFDLGMRAQVNGRTYSQGSFADIHWSFAQMLAYASRGTELRPGDVVGSGTVGTGCILELSRVHGTDTYPWLRPGDHVRLELDQVGAIDVNVVDGAPVRPLT